MKTKRKIFTALALISASFISNADSYVIKVPVKIEPTWESETKYSEWAYGDLYDCSEFTPNSNTVNYPNALTQTRNCKQEQSRSYTTTRYDKFSNTTEVVDTGTIINTIDSVDSKQTIGSRHVYYVQACGYGGCQGNAAKISYDGNIYSSGRGWNLVVVNKDTKAVTYQGKFDTWGDTTASSRLITKLNSIPNGDLVLLTTYDEPSNNMASNLYSTLNRDYKATINVNTSLVNRGSYFLISVKGSGSKIDERIGGLDSFISSGTKYHY